MKKNHSFLLIILCLLFVLTGCGQNSATVSNDAESGNLVPSTSTERVNLNVSILLDLSDRISTKKYPTPGMEINQRDLGYIKSISSAFVAHLNKSKVMKINDQIQVYFEPEPMNTKINALANSMKLSFKKDNITKESIAKIIPTYSKAASQIYQLALEDQQFVGSDIWTFFKNKVKDYCILPKHRNLLIILTDGYLYHQDNKIREGNLSTYLTPELISAAKLNISGYQKMIEEKKYGFILATDHLENLEVLVLGINPEKGKNFEGDVIRKYWGDWLTGMGVQKFNIKGTDLPSNLDPVIKEILLEKH